MQSIVDYHKRVTRTAEVVGIKMPGKKIKRGKYGRSWRGSLGELDSETSGSESDRSGLHSRPVLGSGKKLESTWLPLPPPPVKKPLQESSWPPLPPPPSVRAPDQLPSRLPGLPPPSSNTTIASVRGYSSFSKYSVK